MSHFQKQGRALLANGYLIVPIRPGDKRPALKNWQTSRIGASDLANYTKHGVGVLCGQGAHPVCAIDVDTTDAELAQRFIDWCSEHLGVTCERVGKAPKILLPYRAAESGWRKGLSTPFSTDWVSGPDGWYSEGWKTVERNGRDVNVSTGQIHRVEVLGYGQQFVAYHIHPDTGQPYEWVDIFGGIEFMRADDLPVVTEEQVRHALVAFDEMARLVGLQAHPSGRAQASAPTPPKERTPAEDEDFFGRVNEAALANLTSWVPALFPAAREYQDGYRIASVDLGRDLEEDVSVVPDGIVDFGVADMGDERQGKRTPIDLVMEWSTRMFDDPLDAPTSPFDAALWLCDCLGTPKEELGFGLRKQREKAAERSAKRIAMSGLVDKIKACEDSIALMDEVAKQARALIAETPELHAEIAGALKTRFKELTGVTLPVVDLNRALREPSAPTVKARRPLTEFGNAERMLDRYGQGLMFVPEMGSWYCWTGVYWRKSPDVEIEHLAKETVKALVGEIADHPEPAEFFKFCAISQQAKMVRNMVTLAQSDPRVMVPARELDKYSHLMGAANGVIDLRTGDLLPPDPELRITKIAGCDYVPGAKAPLFRQTVVDVFNDDADMVAFFQRLVGYAAMGQPNQDVMVIPHGNGSNGKSTVLGTIRLAFGGYAKAAEAGTFVSDAKGGGNAGAAREDLVRLKGARFVYVNEPDENSELREGSVKAMTGGDAITARGVYGKESVEFLPSWVVFMPTNHKPIVKGSDNGIWRRLMLIPFTRNFEADPTIVKDPNRETKLQAEIEGVLAWVVEGALAYQAQGLNQVGAVKAAREAYREQMDLLSEWLEECCEVGPTYEVESSHLWKSWEEYAKNRGLLTYVKNSVALGRRLDARFPAGKGSGGVRIRRGLRIRCDFDDLV